MQNKLFRYGAVLTSHDVWKAVAIALMVVDHVGTYFLADIPELRLIGRLSFPLFFFLIGFGYVASARKHLWAPWSWVVGAAVLVAGDIALGRDVLPLNILVSALAVRVFLKNIEAHHWFPKHVIALLVLAVLWHYPLVMVFEYGGCALLFALLGYAVANQAMPRICYAIAGVAVVAYSYVQSIGFGFSYVHTGLLLCGMLVLARWMLTYTSSQTKINIASPCGAIVALCSRYSLEVYVLHLLVFRLVASKALVDLL